jgi:excisionase family DNA binding protein
MTGGTSIGQKTMPPDLISPQEAAGRLGVSRWTVYRLIWNDTLQAVQIGRCRRIVRQSLDAYISDLIERATES